MFCSTEIMTNYLRTRAVYKVGFHLSILQRNLFVSITKDAPCGCSGKLVVVGEMLCGTHSVLIVIEALHVFIFINNVLLGRNIFI